MAELAGFFDAVRGAASAPVLTPDNDAATTATTASTIQAIVNGTMPLAAPQTGIQGVSEAVPATQ